MKEEFDRAIADFDLAIKLNPKDAAVDHDRSIVWHDKGDANNAIADLSAEAQLDPKCAAEFQVIGAE